ncbi:Jouberin [Nibea albiflora]|nr:Jouberin [Nibea albiflora]
MQQIYRQSNKQFEVYTTVFSPQGLFFKLKALWLRTLLLCDWQVVVAVTQYRARWPKELDLKKGDLVRVLFKEDETWWFGRLTDGNEGYFPVTCVEPLQVKVEPEAECFIHLSCDVDQSSPRSGFCPSWSSS